MAKKYRTVKEKLAVKERPVSYATFPRITFNPNIMAGQACIRGMRIPVSLVVNLVANGMENSEIIREYPDLEPADITEALRYAAWLTREEVLASAV